MVNPRESSVPARLPQVGEARIAWVVTNPRASRARLRVRGGDPAAPLFEERDPLSVSLQAGSAAEPLYERLGFSDGGPRALSLRLDG